MALTAFASQTQFSRESGIYNVKADGAIGDGTTDDTVAIQTTLNRFTNGVAATASGHIYFPKGRYKITAPLIYGGGLNYGLRIEGGLGGSKAAGGACIDWYGPTGGTMFISAGANAFLMENLEFNGRGLARYGVHFSTTLLYNTTLGTVVTPGSREVTPGAMTNIAVNTLLNVDSGADLEYVYVTAVTASTFTALFVKSHGSSAVVGGGSMSDEVVLRRVTIGAAKGTGSAAIALGNATSSGTPQSDIVIMHDLYLYGDGDGTSVAGIKLLSGGNTKNFYVYGGTITTFQYGVDALAVDSGVFSIEGVTFLGVTVADVRMSTCTMYIQSVESENNATAGGLFVTGTTGENKGSLVVIGSSWEGHLGTDDVLIRYSGNITLIGNSLMNLRTGSTWPKIETNALFSDITPSAVCSMGNYYRNAPAGFIPVVTSAPADVFAGTNSLLSITSLGDFGGIGGDLIKLTNFIPNAVVGGLTMANATNIVLNATTGTKIGTATTQKLALWNQTPITQPAGIVDADGTLADITTKFNSLLGKLESIGIVGVA